MSFFRIWASTGLIPRVASIGVVSSIAAGSIYTYRQDDGIRRSTLFWSRAFPMYLHYRWVERRVSDQDDAAQTEAYGRLHRMYAPQAEQLTLQLRGFYLKAAQLVSSFDDSIPKAYLDWCKRLQDAAPVPMRAGQAREIVETTLETKLGRFFDDVFDVWEEQPIGSASIGVVHRARLRESGQWVAVKVQQPGAEHMFRSDLRTIQRFCALAMTQFTKSMEEVERQFLTEFDYRGEAQNLLEIYDNVMPIFGDRVAIPRPILELCHKDILVMEYLEGIRLVDGVRAKFQAMAEQQGLSLEELEANEKQAITEGRRKLRTLEEQKRQSRSMENLIRMVSLLQNTGKVLFNWTLGWIPGVSNFEYSKSETPINLAEVLELLLLVHGHELLMNGCFNGDPHPGNIMLLTDGRLGLVDYGQVKRFTPEQRRAFAKLIIALDRDDRDEIVRALTDDLGVRTASNNPEVLYRLACFWNDRDTEDILQGRTPQQFLDWAEKVDPIRDPGEFIMASRMSMLLRGMGRAFGLQLRTAPIWAPMAYEVLDRSSES